VNDITLLDSWDISAQGHFTQNTDLFPGKISNSLNRCPMKAVVSNNDWWFTTKYVHYNEYNGNVEIFLEGLEGNLLNIVLKQMNMTFVYVPMPNDSGIVIDFLSNLMFDKEAYIALGGMVKTYITKQFFDFTDTYSTMRIRWYVPCSVKCPRWSSIFRILSLELWLVLIMSIVTAVISFTLVGRYSCTSEWQGYKTVISSLTNVWAVILGVAVSTMPRTPSLRSLFLAWLCFSVAFSTVFQAFLTTFLIDSGYETPIQNMDELFGSGIKLAYASYYSSIFESVDEIFASKVQRYGVICPTYEDCIDWVHYHNNISILLPDDFV
jgi:hypothetical protein